MKNYERYKKFKIGMRTIKTGIAIAITLYISSLFNLRSPVFAGIGAIVAMQSSVSESFIMGYNRMLATFVGAFIGLIFSYIFPQNPLFIGIGIMIVIHIHYIMDWKKSLTLSAIVFLSISFNNQDARFMYAINRLIDTFTGILVGMVVNYFIYTPNTEKPFIDAITGLYSNSKSIVYELVKGQREISLSEFKKEIAKIEDSYKLLKQDLDMNFYKPKDFHDFNEILSILDDIYNNISTLVKIEEIPVINEDNKLLLEKLYSTDILPKEEVPFNELDVVYNYHLNKILNCLLKIEEIL